MIAQELGDNNDLWWTNKLHSAGKQTTGTQYLVQFKQMIKLKKRTEHVFFALSFDIVIRLVSTSATIGISIVMGLNGTLKDSG
jgi:hypothetical protein